LFFFSCFKTKKTTMGNLCFGAPQQAPHFHIQLPAGRAPIIKIVFAAGPEEDLPEVPEVPYMPEETEVALSTLEDLDLVQVHQG
jgi:hypothetical protein